MKTGFSGIADQVMEQSNMNIKLEMLWQFVEF